MIAAATETAQRFKAFADENRLSILAMLTNGEKCACVILEELDISQSTLSHHMKLLSDAEIISTRREGKWAYYSLAPQGFESVRHALDELAPRPSRCEVSNDCCAPDTACCGSEAKGIELDSEKKELFKQVQERYAQAADRMSESGNTSCCSSSEVMTSSPAASDNLGAKLYRHENSPEINALPEDALLASLGCGNPTAVANLSEGEVVLDLGSGGGIDVLLSAARVGESGFAYGLDMTDGMLELARKNACEAGAQNVEFLKGHIEEIPLGDSTIDVVISNCVINLSIDKPAVFKEIARVLRDGGRIGVSDVVADNGLSPQERAERGDYAGCIAGALSFEEYNEGLSAAGFTDISIEPTHEVADGMFAAIIKAAITK